MSEYYDKVLVAIPLISGVIPLVMLASGFPTSTSLILGLIPTLGVIGHALFVRNPTQYNNLREAQNDDSEKQNGKNGGTPPLGQ